MTVCPLTWRTTLLVRCLYLVLSCLRYWLLNAPVLQKWFCSVVSPSGRLIMHLEATQRDSSLPICGSRHDSLLTVGRCLLKQTTEWKDLSMDTSFHSVVCQVFPLAWPGSGPRGSRSPHQGCTFGLSPGDSEHRCWWSHRASVADLVGPRRMSSSWHRPQWVLCEVLTGYCWTGSRVPCVSCGSTVSPSLKFLPNSFGLTRSVSVSIMPIYYNIFWWT